MILYIGLQVGLRKHFGGGFTEEEAITSISLVVLRVSPVQQNAKFSQSVSLLAVRVSLLAVRVSRSYIILKIRGGFGLRRDDLLSPFSALPTWRDYTAGGGRASTAISFD